MKLLILALGAVGLLTGCAASDNGNGDTGHVTQSAYDPALCTILLPDTGRPALMTNLKVTHAVTSAYFDKRYNRAMLEGVLEASGNETQKFVSGLGIDVAKIPTKDGGCMFQHELPQASSELQQTWDQVAGGDHGGGHLDGLFVAFTASKQAIMVREDSSRWTLVHEMMRANFFRQRIADGSLYGTALRSAVRTQFALLKSDLGSYDAKANEEDAAKLEQDTLETAKILYQSLVSGSLEEIADESLLLEEWSAGRLGYVSNSSAKNAAWYIDYSRTLSLQDLNDFTTTVGQLRDIVLANVPENRTDDLFKTDTTAQFQKALDFITSVNTMTADMAQKAKDRTASLAVGDSNQMIVGLSSKPVAGFVELTNAHLAEMNNTPAIREFRRQNAALFN